MRFPRLLLSILLSLLTTLTFALPGGGEVSSSKDEPVLIPNEAATWHCTHKYKVLYSHYKLSGCDWNKTEEEIKRAISNEGIITRWQYNEENNTGHVGFESSVSFRCFRGGGFFLQRATTLLTSLFFSLS
jgi:hypothetical protein